MTFDSEGNVLSVTVQEPRFTPSEKAILLASRRSSLAPRNDLGILISEATDPANQFSFDVPRRDNGAPAPSTDWAQKALDDAQEQYRKMYPNESLSSKLWRVFKRPS